MTEETLLHFTIMSSLVLCEIKVLAVVLRETTNER